MSRATHPRLMAARLIERCRSAVVLSHVRPDGDAVGSATALDAVIRAMGKRSRVFLPERFPSRYGWLRGSGRISVSAEAVLPRGADLVVAVDSATLARTGFAGRLPPGAAVVNIDHHVSNERFGDVAWVEGRASSVGEMLLSLAVERRWPLPAAAREALYAAVYTDTGRFSYANTTPEALRLAAWLVERGVSPDRMCRMLYSQREPRDLALEAAARASLRTAAGGRIASVALSSRDFRRCGASPVDAQEFVQIPMSLKGVEIGVFAYELGGGLTKVSLRSSGDFDVNRFASRHGGGGHARAAGCETRAPVAKALAAVVRELVAERGFRRRSPSRKKAASR